MIMIFTEQELIKLDQIIDEINNLENLTIDNLSSVTENPQFFLKIMSKIKINKIKKMLKDDSKPIYHTYKQYDIEYIYDVFEKNNPEEIKKTYSLTQLKDFFYSIYNIEPKNKSKENIIRTIQDTIRTRYRAQNIIQKK